VRPSFLGGGDFGLGELAAEPTVQAQLSNQFDKLRHFPGRRNWDLLYGQMIHGPIAGYQPWVVVDARKPGRAQIIGPHFSTEMALVTAVEKHDTTEGDLANILREMRYKSRAPAARVPQLVYTYYDLPGVKYGRTDDDRWQAYDVTGDRPVPLGPSYESQGELVAAFDFLSREPATFRKEARALVKRRQREKAQKAQRAKKPQPSPATKTQSRGVKPFALMINPKTLDLVEMYRSPSHNYRLGFLGKPESCIANAYTAEDADLDGQSYVRIHSPGTCENPADFSVGGVNPEYQGDKYGLLLYAGVAVDAYLNRDYKGVFSQEGTRSRDADKLWSGLVKHGTAHDVEGHLATEEEVENTDQFCCEVEAPGQAWFDVRRNGSKVYRKEICENLDYTEMVESDDAGTFQVIKGEEMLDSGFVLWASNLEDDAQTAPVDLAVRAKVKDKDGALRLGQILRDKYGETAYLSFMGRTDIRELFGQHRLPGISGTAKPPELPPLSDRSKRLIALFDDLPAVGKDLEGPDITSAMTSARSSSGRDLDGPALDGPALGDLGARPRRAEEPEGNERMDLLAERDRLWREQERWAFRSGPAARKKENEIEAEIHRVEERIRALPRTTLEGIYAGSGTAIVLVLAGGALLGGLLWALLRAHPAPVAPVPLNPLQGAWR
jgi:hypothetical protein